MSTRSLISFAGRALVGGACLLTSVSCGSEMLRTGRSPVYLVVNSVEAPSNGSTSSGSAFLLSDVFPVANDNAIVHLSTQAKNQSVPTTPLNSVSLTRFRVNFRRADGRNTPGVDVPYGFDGALSLTIPPGGLGNAVLVLVRHEAKEEPPLRNLRDQGGLAIIQAIAEITIYGHDQNGNELSVVALVDVHFADFADQ